MQQDRIDYPLPLARRSMIAFGGIFPLAGIVTFLFGVVYVGGAWTQSHYGMALQILGVPVGGPTIGTARAVRSDEWAVLTPYFQIAVANGLGETNAASPYNEPLRSFYALPTKDWSIIFKPQLWGFLIAAPEYAYSFYHFVLICSILWGFAILLRQMGIAAPWAVLGTLLIFFSRFVQVWWTSIAPTFAFAPWPLIAALVPISPWWRFVLVFYAGAIWLFGLLYVPFIIGGAFALGGLLIALRRDALRMSVLLPTGCGALAALFLVLWYYGDLFSIMRDTVYPGSRISAGGHGAGYLISHIFPYVDAVQFQPTLPSTNECEIATLSSYLPLLIATFTDHKALLERIRIHWWTAGAFALCTLLTLAWLVLPIPPEIGQIFLWHRVPPGRLIWAFGLLTTFASVWLASIASWRISIPRLGIFLVVAGGAWFGVKAGAALRSWFDGVILVTVSLAAAFALSHSGVRSSNGKGILLVGSAVLTSAVTFGTFNPLQSARPIFNPPVRPIVERLRHLAAGHPNGWVAITGLYGAVLAGLGLPSINHALLQPRLQFFRTVFPEMESDEFNAVFNRYMHAYPDTVNEPRVYRPDVVQLPITRFGTPLDVISMNELPALDLEQKGQIESVRFDLDDGSWRLWLEGWVPFEQILPGQELGIIVPKDLAPLVTSIRAVRNFRPGLTAEIAGGDFRIGGFIAEIQGNGDPSKAEISGRSIRILSRVSNVAMIEAASAPTTRVRAIEAKNEIAELPARGSIDAIQLEKEGSVLALRGWIVPPTKEPIDEVVFFLDLPSAGAELSWFNRPDVVRARITNYLLTGFKIQIKLRTPLSNLPVGALCVAVSSAGKLMARTDDNKVMPCR